MRPHIMILLATCFLLPTASAGALDLLDLNVRVGDIGVGVSTRDGVKVDAPLPAPVQTPIQAPAQTQTARGEGADVQPAAAQPSSVEPEPSAWSAAVGNPWLVVVIMLGAMLFLGVIWSGLSERKAAKKA